MKKVKKDTSLYNSLETAFDFFNQELFSSELPKCLISIRCNRLTAAYLSKERWTHADGTKTHELAINPMFINGNSLRKLFQVIVHEQVHLLHVIKGTACRYGYHDKKWAITMKSIGLMPSDTGLEGGKTTGQKMSEYPLKGGKFIASCEKLLASGFTLDWVDSFYLGDKSYEVETFKRTLTEDDIKILLDNETTVETSKLLENYKNSKSAYEKRKSKYKCPGCGVTAWAKKKVHLICGKCNVHIPEVEHSFL